MRIEVETWDLIHERTIVCLEFRSNYNHHLLVHIIFTLIMNKEESQGGETMNSQLLFLCPIPVFLLRLTTILKTKKKLECKLTITNYSINQFYSFKKKILHRRNHL